MDQLGSTLRSMAVRSGQLVLAAMTSSLLEVRGLEKSLALEFEDIVNGFNEAVGKEVQLYAKQTGVQSGC